MPASAHINHAKIKHAAAIQDYRAQPGLPLVEVVDQNNRPLLLMPPDEAKRQTLRHRGIIILTYSFEYKLFLQKRKWDSPTSPEIYDLSMLATVLAGESVGEAAGRVMKDQFGLRTAHLKKLGPIPACAATGQICFTMFSTNIAQSIFEKGHWTQCGLMVNRNELKYLVAEHDNLLSPLLRYFWEKNMLFRPSCSK